MTPRALFAAVLLLAASCASRQDGLAPGQSTTADVRTAMGAPTLVRKTPDGGEVLWYSRLPMGRQSYAARMDAKGTLVALEPRLTSEQLAKVRVNSSTSEEVLDILGPPYRVLNYPRQQREAWEYQMRMTGQDPTIYIQLSPDKVVREVIQIYEQVESEK